MPFKIERLNATVEDARPNPNFRILPGRLTKQNVSRILRDELGLGVHVAAAAENADSNEPRFGYQREPSDFAIPVARLDSALKNTSLSISDRLRLKFAVDRLGLLNR